MGESESKNDRSSLVMLKPFIHQVGGHSSIQQFDQYTVCKPLFSKELRFYQEVGATFKPFIPEFKGVVNVRDVKESENSRFQVASSHNHIKLHTYRYGKHCSTCSCQRDEHRSKKRKKRTESENSSSEEEAVSNSSTLNRDSPHFDDSSLEYILLENVVGHYKYPCILDLKMGTEKHKDYVVSKEEADRRQARWDQTTSRSLGVRVCGMKVYLVNKSGFSVMSGGRDLTVEGFRNAIKTFLHNGERSRHEVIELFLKQLDKLLNIMEKQSSYRFYNTSLLLIYEGDDCSVMDDCSEDVASNCEDSERARPEEDENSRVKVGVRMIDFAHVHHNSLNGKSEVSQHVPDESYLFGLRSVIRILKETLAELRPE